MYKKDPDTGCKTGCAVTFTSVPVVGEERECVEKASWFTRHCKGRMYRAGSFVYNDCGFFATDEATNMDVMDTKSPWVQFSLTWVFSKLFKGYHEDDWSCDMNYDEGECVPYCGKYRVSLRAENGVEPSVSDKLPEAERWWSAPLTLCELIEFKNCCPTTTTTTIDEGCGRKITTDDGESTWVGGSKFFERRLIGEAEPFRIKTGTSYRVEYGSPVRLEPIVIKKSDCCVDYGNGIGLDIQVSAMLDSDTAKGAAVVNYDIDSGYGKTELVDSCTVVVQEGTGDMANRTEPHKSTYPWKEDGTIEVTPVIELFPDAAGLFDGYINVQVFADECVCANF